MDSFIHTVEVLARRRRVGYRTPLEGCAGRGEGKELREHESSVELIDSEGKLYVAFVPVHRHHGNDTKLSRRSIDP